MANFFALQFDGTLKNLGEREDYEDADEAAPDAIWLIDEDAGRQWLDCLSALQKDA